jgi:hypothetical protein
VYFSESFWWFVRVFWGGLGGLGLKKEGKCEQKPEKQPPKTPSVCLSDDSVTTTRQKEEKDHTCLCSHHT